MLGPDYKELANEAVRAGIAAQEAEEPRQHLLPRGGGGGGFPSIADDQRFYINEAGNPVLIFEKYEVAPGYMGQPEFGGAHARVTGWAAGRRARSCISSRAFYSCVPAQTGEKDAVYKIAEKIGLCWKGYEIGP